MQQNTNLQTFDDWMSWKDNVYKLNIKSSRLSKTNTPKHLNKSITYICSNLGLRPIQDFQITMYEVRFRTKTFLAMFKMNFNENE